MVRGKAGILIAFVALESALAGPLANGRALVILLMFQILMSLETVPEAPSNVPANTVSWQSAFWALVPLALNSMSQPSGMVCDFPSRFNFLLRSSPIICLLDALLVIARLAWYTAALKSPSAAVERIIRRRFQDIENEAEENSLASLQKNSLFRLCLFTLGVLPQTIKLYAIRGLPWTKVWGSMFFGSFIVVELIVLVSRRLLQPLAPNVSRASVGEGNILNSLPRVGPLFVSLGFSFHFFTIAFFSVIGRYVKEVYWWHFAVLMTFIVAELICLSFPRSEWLLILSFLVTVPTSMIFSAIVPTSFGVSLVEMQSKASLSVLTGLSVIFALRLTIFNLFRLFVYVSPARAKFVDFGVGFYFLMLNIIAALLYYRFKYSSEGTLKPAWAEQLG
jgi:hypothetical protein